MTQRSKILNVYGLQHINGTFNRVEWLKEKVDLNKRGVRGFQQQHYCWIHQIMAAINFLSVSSSVEMNSTQMVCFLLMLFAHFFCCNFCYVWKTIVY